MLGMDRDPQSLKAALDAGVIDAATDFAGAARCDVCLLAIPVRQYAEVLSQLAPHLAATTLITDVGSTKQDVIEVARDALANDIGRFVPGHPIAGREKAGASAAVTDLFAGKNVVLTPLPENVAAAVETVSALWRDCGANVMMMPAATHDTIFAAVSHLPHLLAFALVDELAARPNAKALFSFAASGFRDFTRIASSSPEMWRDIALNNRGPLVREFDLYMAHAKQLRDAVAAGDGEAIDALMHRARDARDRWLAGDLEQFRDESA